MIGNRLRTAIVAFGLVGSATAMAQEGQTLTEQGKMEQVIRDYLLSHPEVIVESIQRYQQQQEQAAAAKQATALVDLRDELTRSPDSPVLGNPDGNVAVVEFFDYRCPYCKLMATRKLMETLEQDGNIRIVMKEFPILGEDSMYAAKAALAAHRQGKYRELHMAMMLSKGKVTAEDVRRLAQEAGIDVGRMAKDMEAPEIAAEIGRNNDLAGKIGVTGTPAFVINDRLVPGAVEVSELMNLIAAARKQ